MSNTGQNDNQPPVIASPQPRIDSLEQAILRTERELGRSQPDHIERSTETKPERTDYHGAGIGIEFVANIMIPPVAGYFLDSYFETKPAFFLTFLFLGFVGAFYFLYRLSVNAGGRVGFSALHNEKKQAKRDANN